MKKKFKIVLLCFMILLTFGCTKNIKDENNKPVVYEITGQTLTANILCKPTTEDLYNKYKENEQYITTSLDELPSCEDFKVTDLKYVSLWESIFVKPLAWVILSVGKLVKNYGISVILISIIIRILLIPLTKSSINQSQNMQKASKDLEKIEKKYKDKNDNESMIAKSQETMMIYKKYNINPMAGCLGSLIQLPILFAFLEAINRVPAIFEGKLFNMNLGMTPRVGLSQGNYIYILLIILILFTTFLSFKITMKSQPGQSKDQMKMMMTMMIVMIGLASFSLPTALAFYWVVNNVFAMVQNIILKKLNESR